MVYLDKGLKIKKGYMLGRRKNVPVVMPPTVMHPSEYFFSRNRFRVALFIQNMHRHLFF